MTLLLELQLPCNKAVKNPILQNCSYGRPDAVSAFFIAQDYFGNFVRHKAKKEFE